MYSYFWTRKHAILGTRLVDGRLYAVRVWRARRVCGRQSAGRTVSAVFESRSERASNGKSDIHIQKGYTREILLISWGQLTFTTYISIAWRSRVELVGYRSTCPSSVPIMACPPPSLQQNRRRACAGGRGLPGVKVNSPGAMWWLLSASRLCCRSVAAQHTNTHHSVYAPGTTHSPPPKNTSVHLLTHIWPQTIYVCARISLGVHATQRTQLDGHVRAEQTNTGKKSLVHWVDVHVNDQRLKCNQYYRQYGWNNAKMCSKCTE